MSKAPEHIETTVPVYNLDFGQPRTHTEALAGAIAMCVFPYISDCNRQRELFMLMTRFAEEIKRSAIEP